jgi:hypothetical protein
MTAGHEGLIHSTSLDINIQMSSSPPFPVLSSSVRPTPTQIVSKKRKIDDAWKEIIGELKDGKSIRNVAKHHPNVSKSAIHRKWKKCKSGTGTSDVSDSE